MIVAAVRHSVADYDRWKAGFDAYPPTSNGAKFARVNRSIEDPDVVAVVMGFDSVEAAQAFLDSPELAAKMQEAGVSGPPRIELYDEVAAI